ncbi:uncharacterized protein LOC135332900 [Halichondria panicea]|uniref:uncharacterized protein LOC135332900 n=1 Tax=Halichondria panicea TaxID=6063 RepID=UPI00312B56B7
MCAFCSTGPECEPLPLQAETEHHDGAAAVVQCEKVWQREILKVYFMNPPVLDSWRIGVTTQQILDWANEAWRKDPMNSNIPEFNLCEVLNKADIRVKFAEMKGTKSEGYWSMVGMHAKECGSKPTMVLDLTDEFIIVKQNKKQEKSGHPSVWTCLGV